MLLRVRAVNRKQGDRNKRTVPLSIEAACSYSDDKYKVVWVMGDPLLGILLER